MARVIKTESAGKDRNRLSRAVVLAIREFMKQTEPDETSRDLAAFIALALLEIAQTIDQSVAAWEKRDYWIKADRFRMEWSWAERLGRAMETALIEEDWATIAQTAVQIAQKLSGVRIAERHRLGKPWEGAWEQFQKRKQPRHG